MDGAGERHEPHGRFRGYGVTNATAGGQPTVVARLGEEVVDLDRLHTGGFLDAAGIGDRVFAAGSLNRFMSLGSNAWREVDGLLDELVSDGIPPGALLNGITPMELPFEVADYCDFYASEAHVSNMGKILRPGTDPLPVAWRHIPLGYHGRAGTVISSGARISRPVGLVRSGNGIERKPTERLDLEVELGFVVGTPSAYGKPVTVDEARDHVFGVVLVNDWSARDIQAFEYQPLGPFLGKSFATSISSWVVPLWLLDEFRTDGPEQGDEIAENLVCKQPRALDVHLELAINSNVVSRPQARWLHWSVEQFVAHLTSNGASIRTGDLLATGTISGPDRSTFGSMMELSWAGSEPISISDGSERGWLEDGDIVTISAWCGTGSNRIELGTVTGGVIGASTTN